VASFLYFNMRSLRSWGRKVQVSRAAAPDEGFLARLQFPAPSSDIDFAGWLTIRSSGELGSGRQPVGSSEMKL
jgi:hypothetical protein